MGGFESEMSVPLLIIAACFLRPLDSRHGDVVGPEPEGKSEAGAQNGHNNTKVQPANRFSAVCSTQTLGFKLHLNAASH